MSLSKVHLASIVKQQYQFKLKSYINLFNPLIIMQLIAVLFSLGGIGQGSRGGIEGDFNIYYYTTDYVIVFTIIWGFILAIQITSKDYREQTVPFVTNNLTENLSNIIFILTASTIGGVLAILSRFLFQAIVRFVFNYDRILGTEMTISFTELLMGILATILFIFLFSSFGYMIGMLVQFNRIFVVIIPVFFVGLLFYFASTGGALEDNFVYQLFKFYFQEKVFLLFFLKVMFTSILFYIGSYMISSRLEVK